MRYFLASFCFIALVIGGGEPAGAQTAQSSIEANNADFVAKFAAKDTTGLAQHYTEDAVAFPPNETGSPAATAFRRCGRAGSMQD